jgi:hypothetical protein
MTPAEQCRANGWGVGAVLIAPSGTRAVEVTAVGQRAVIVRDLAGRTTGGVWLPYGEIAEHLWRDGDPDVTAATPAELDAIRGVTQAKGERGCSVNGAERSPTGGPSGAASGCATSV